MLNIENSSRLSFRLMGQDDAQALWALDQDPEVMHFINGGKPHSMETIEGVFLPRMKAYTDANKGWGLWQVADKETNEYLGWVLVRPMDYFSDNPIYTDLELGWRFFKKAWGKGYATEAAEAIKNALAEQSEATHVSALALEENYGSINIMEKIGMKFMKKYIHKDPLGDFNAVHYQMIIK